MKLLWRIARLWEIPAQELLAAGDVGLIPWVPRTTFDGNPESMIRQCRGASISSRRPANAKTCWP